MKPDVQGNVHWIDDVSVIYVAGNNVVQYATDTKQQKLFPGLEGGLGITAMAVSSNRRYLAVAQQMKDHGACVVYDLHTGRKKRVLTATENESTSFVSVAFSADNKFLITQGAAPDWNLNYWAWDKGRALASTKTTNSRGARIHEVSINPQDPSLVCVVGDEIFKFLRMQEGVFKPIPNQLAKLRESQSQNYVTHAWLTQADHERLVVCTEAGDILLFDNNGEYKMVLPCSPADQKSCMCVAAFSKGFVIGGDNSMIRVFERSDDPKEVFRKAKEAIAVVGKRADPTDIQVCGVSVTPCSGEEVLGLVLSSSQLYSMSLSSSDLLKTEEAPLFDQVLGAGFHSGSVTGLDACVRRPLLVTCGVDKTVRVWNYVERTVEVCKEFSEEAYCVAFHPSGFHVLVGFSDKLRLMNLLMEDLKTYKELPIKACRECRFSNGGEYFAAAHGNTIQVYKTYTCEVLCNLRGHNSKVRSVAWSPDDQNIVSCGMDGACYEFDLLHERKKSEWVQKNIHLSCVAVSQDPSTGVNSTYVVGNHRQIQEISASQLSNYEELNYNVGQVAVSQNLKAMFAGVADALVKPGSIVVYKSINEPDVEYQAHSGAVTRMRLSHCDGYLFSVGDDGCVYFWEITRRGKAVGKTKDAVLPFAEEILVTRTFLEETQEVLTFHRIIII